MAKRAVPEINAGSMADIAFLLLVFFLMTSSMASEKGIITILPAFVPEEERVEIEVDKDNVLNITVNAADQLLVEDIVYSDDSQLKEIVMEHILNPNRLENKPQAPDQAIIAIQNDRSTTYDRYIGIYDKIKSAYNQIWEDKAPIMFNGKKYSELTDDEMEDLKYKYPVVISEAEPTDFAQ
jgi:biopolymer transport protein ExbD